MFWELSWWLHVHGGWEIKKVKEIFQCWLFNLPPPTMIQLLRSTFWWIFRFGPCWTWSFSTPPRTGWCPSCLASSRQHRSDRILECPREPCSWIRKRSGSGCCSTWQNVLHHPGRQLAHPCSCWPLYKEETIRICHRETKESPTFERFLFVERHCWGLQFTFLGRANGMVCNVFLACDASKTHAHRHSSID